MLKKVQKNLLAYFRENLGIYSFVSFIFLIGIAAGALTVNYLGESQLSELNKIMTFFLESLKNDFYSLEAAELLKNSYQRNLAYLLVIGLLGILWVGFPIVLIILLFKGFALGFTVGFLVYRSALKGVIFCLAAVVPHNLLLVPAFIVAATAATIFSLLRLRDKIKHRNTCKQYFRSYCQLFFSMIILVLAGGLVEAYITPVFIRLTVSII